jgi:SAM-dependent methyltransferase
MPPPATDAPAHDWEIIARRDPFFGVVSAPEFRIDAMSEDAQARFYATGEGDIASILAMFDADLGARPAGGRALDIGCGVGRLAIAMANVAGDAFGYDVSPTMIELARRRAPPNLTLSTELPDGPFDWINSYIVFQHIPPREGLDLIERCLARAAPHAFLSLQVTLWRDGPQPDPNPLAALRRSLVRLRLRREGPADGLIRMHDYNLSDVMRRAVAAGFGRLVLRHTNHGGHHGAWIIARRDA